METEENVGKEGNGQRLNSERMGSYCFEENDLDGSPQSVVQRPTGVPKTLPGSVRSKHFL